jgi:desulfoferrodoxin (superoxide reductase-like protein)
MVQGEVRMKKFILSLALVLLFSTHAFCHDPAGINVTVQAGGIDLVIYHSVSDPATHYVKRIEVKLNGENSAEKDFTSQTDDMAQKTSFGIPALKKGDLLEITAYCSRYGDVKKTMTVE